MNDLRSRNRGLAAVPDEGSVPTSTPPRVRPEPASATATDGTAPATGSPAVGDPGERAESPGDDRTGGAGNAGMTMPRRQSIAERVGQTGEVDRVTAEPGSVDHKFTSSRPVVPATDEPVSAPSPRSASADEGPESRPTRRRDLPEDVDEPEERFPWHHQYHDDEPEEMQASSPLLSRAFRSSTG